LNLVQLRHKKQGRRIALVSDPKLRLLESYASIYALAWAAIGSKIELSVLANRDLSGEELDYDSAYAGDSDWQILPAFDHPEEPARCLVSGTGLTHKASAARRAAMHEKEGGPKVITDSMRMFQWGLEGGHPAYGTIGVQPEWFYKGSGTILRGHGKPLGVPPYANDGGEEPEVAGAYLIDPSGNPWRVGLTIGNEFSDHKMEAKNYLYLAPAKLRTCSIGPELVVGAPFDNVPGAVCIERVGRVIWTAEIATGEANMSHSLANLEYHHFKYAAHRRPGDAHIHFFGADAFSFGDKVELRDGDMMVVEWQGFGRALRNPIRVDQSSEPYVCVQEMS